MPDHLPDHCVPHALCVVLNCVSDITDPLSFHRLLYSLLETLACYI